MCTDCEVCEQAGESVHHSSSKYPLSASLHVIYTKQKIYAKLSGLPDDKLFTLQYNLCWQNMAVSCLVYCLLKFPVQNHNLEIF